jgi:hypothetical protein
MSWAIRSGSPPVATQLGAELGVIPADGRALDLGQWPTRLAGDRDARGEPIVGG